MNARLEKLYKWGCNVSDALQRMLDDEDFYLECLDEIAHDSLFQQLDDAIRIRNIKSAFEYAHTLKGVLANLGLTPMYELTVDVVEPLRAGQIAGLQDKTNALLKMQAQLIKILEE